MKVRIVGRGNVGRSLHRALRSAPEVQASLSRGRAARVHIRSGTDLVILAVPDAAIESVAARVHAAPGTCIVHVAGARGVDALAACRAAQLNTGVMHPLVSFSNGRAEGGLAGASFVCWGDPAARRQLHAVCRALGVRPIMRNVHGPAYHAAAALVANGSAALADAGSQILQGLGFSARDAQAALAGLLESVARNVRQVGVPGALTGPIVRGDALTVRRHLDALTALGAKHARDYLDVAPSILASAQRAGLAAGPRRRLARVLQRKR